MNILKFDSLPSTNDKAKELAASGAEHGTVITAREQTAGRGTKGRSFYSPRGGLYISVINRRANIRGPEETENFTNALALKAASAVRSVTGKPATVKWINDVMLDGKKIGGILAEARFFGKPEWIVIGAGINVCVRFPPELEQIAGSLYDSEPDAEKIHETLLTRLAEEFIMID